MSVSQRVEVREDLVNRVRSVVLKEFEKMRTTIEEGDINVYTALVDDDVEKLVIIALREAGQPLSWREIKAVFSGVVGEDRLRKILSSLKARNQVAELTHTRYSLPEYVPPNEVHKIKNPGILSKVVKLLKMKQATQ